ncbi:FAD-binding oxidoreductase [Allokutzneria sp. A3M-2-11 16]|uniref:FAD-binding and (Fe-S)-binding domain-containing protein n=1 Tax=Allokutzneria sp. A3M-2-11 16 TaxID=2962043 RepID=UPI0020B6F106|nr:FAD-linked oxidase C-terminal domain-containing protein [Allokutzneria sp. A3M-2-11 16]MCP3799411.1 FAD-binding oxidoreductase [Allokutzneria sp. A3M-2-11 16]
MARQRDFVRHLTSELPYAARVDDSTRAAYTSDASIYRAVPVAVVEPRSRGEAAKAVRIAVEHEVPVTCRGGGTSIAGNSIGSGLVIDFSRHLNRLRAIDPDARTAVVEPGLVLSRLLAATARHGLTFGPDPSTLSRCTLGGMIGNNACGPHSVAWGTTADNVVDLDVLLADGRTITARTGSSGDPELDQRLRALTADHLAEFRTELGRFSRQVSGYGLASLLPENGFDVARALVGSEGTCGVVLGATVRLAELPKAKVLVVQGFDDVYQAASAAPELARTGVLTAEGMDAHLIGALRSRPGGSAAADLLPPGQAWVYCEVPGDTIDEALARAKEIGGKVVTDPAETTALWKIRRDGAGLATRMADGGEAWPGWEDSAVPPERLADYLRELHGLMDSMGRKGIAYGHFGEGCLHLRVGWDLTTARGIGEYREFIERAADLVASHGGSFSGEHGDGRARSELLPRMYSPRVIDAFAAFKGAFDPTGALNPGLLVDPKPLDSDIRPGPGHNRLELTPVHALSHDKGSFAGAIRRCLGVGSCRQSSGTMCPSFQVTGDEVHSTRGRARVLSEMLRGEFIAEGWRSEAVRDALDLCLSCKACKSACPVNVDMATYKAEFLHNHYKGRVRPRAHYALGWLPLWARLASIAPGLANALGGRTMLRLAGLEPRRKMIRFARKSLRGWMRGRPPAPGSAGTVVLWPDTFTNLLDPTAGRAAVEVLEALGYRVELPEGPVCCGLTWHSTGQLGVARRVLRKSMRSLESQLRAGSVVVGLEPSCTQVLRDDAKELLPDDPTAELLSTRVRTLGELVAAHEGPLPFKRLDAAAVVQVHCHQEAGAGYDAELSLLRELGIDVDRIGAGCCGLAGNFGFEPGHWEVAQECAERELYPKARAASAGTAIIADGFSCRTQVAQGTPRRAEHLAEVLRRALISPAASSRSGD